MKRRKSYHKERHRNPYSLLACVAGARKNGRTRGRRTRGEGAPSPFACLPLARPFFLAPTTSKRLLRWLRAYIRGHHRTRGGGGGDLVGWGDFLGTNAHPFPPNIHPSSPHILGITAIYVAPLRRVGFFYSQVWKRVQAELLVQE